MRNVSLNDYRKAIIPLIKDKQWELALPKCDDLIQAFPQQVQGYVWKGNALVKLGKYQQAEAVFERIKRKHPKNVRGLRGLAQVAVRTRQWPLALERCEDLIKAFPQQVQGYVWKGTALAELGEQQQAEAVFYQISREHPEEVQGLRGLAQVAVRTCQWPLALERCEDLIKAFPQQVQGYVWKGIALAELGEQQQAKAVFEELRSKYPEDPQGMVHVTRLAIRNEQWELALLDSDVLLLNHPQHIQGYLLKANSLIQLDQHEAAQSVLLKCLRSDLSLTETDRVKILNLLLNTIQSHQSWRLFQTELEQLIKSNPLYFSLEKLSDSGSEFLLLEKFVKEMVESHMIGELKRFISLLSSQPETSSLADLFDSRIAIQIDESLAKQLLIQFGETHPAWLDYTQLQLATDAWGKVKLHRCIEYCDLISPENPTVYGRSALLKAEALVRQGRTEAAKEQLHALINLGLAQAPAYILLIEILFFQDSDYEKALQECNKAIENGLSHRKIISYRCLILSRIGEVEYAKELIESATQNYPFNPTLTMTRFQIMRDGQEYSHSLSLINEWLQRGKFLPIQSSSPSSSLNTEHLFCEPEYSISKSDMISVVMTLYKTHSYFPFAVSSILNQTYRNIELIVVDDASPDDTFDRLKDMARTDSRIKPYRLSKNSGTYVAKNYGMQQATGTYISFMDSDDWLHPQALERQIKLLQSSQVIGVKCGFLRVFQGDQIEFKPEGPGSTAHITLCFKRKPLLESVGFFDSVRTAADVEYQKRVELVFGKSAVKEIRFPLLFSTRHESSITGGGSLKIPWYGATEDVLSYISSCKQWHHNIVLQNLSPVLPHPVDERPFDAPASFDI